MKISEYDMTNIWEKRGMHSVGDKIVKTSKLYTIILSTVIKINAMK